MQRATRHPAVHVIATLAILAAGVLQSRDLCAEAASAAPDKSVTFKSNARLVLIDVVVSDDAGQPVHGLRAQDFTVTEDGKSQRITGFQEQQSDAKAKLARSALNLPKNVYTNFVSRSDTGALTVLLFDSLNTDRQHLTYAKQEILKFLKSLPPGKRVALFTLGNQLRMVQSFTENTDVLIAASQELSSAPHSTYSNAKEMSAALGELSESGIMHSPAAYRAVASFMADEYQGHLETRAHDTLDALTQLARALAVVPGRKNLIWISAGFPFDISGNSQQMQKVAALLAATQIAVYPIDVRGVMTMSADGSTRGSELGGPVHADSYETLSGQDQENVSLQETMVNMARLTGGHAYFNRNDLHTSIASGMETGSNYYTLAYRPENADWNGKFRKVTVKATRPKLKLLYRSGYYARLDPLGSTDDPNRVVSLAMQPTAPLSTQLIMKSRVVPPDEADKPVVVDILVDAHDLSFNQTADAQKTPEVQFVAIAWDANGRQCASFSEGYHATLSPQQLQALMRTGLQLHQEMMLKPGAYQLRLGVMDRLSGRIGTLDVPLTIEAKIAAK
jgi:VWFA-related protein